MTQPSEESIRAACDEARLSFEAGTCILREIERGLTSPVHRAILALARRIAAEREAVPVAGKRPYCETCSKDVPEVLCQTCAKWWHDNPPEEAVPVAWMIDTGPKLGKVFFDLPTSGPGGDAIALYTHRPMEPLGPEFEKVWQDNIKALYIETLHADPLEGLSPIPVSHRGMSRCNKCGAEKAEAERDLFAENAKNSDRAGIVAMIRREATRAADAANHSAEYDLDRIARMIESHEDKTT